MEKEAFTKADAEEVAPAIAITLGMVDQWDSVGSINLSKLEAMKLEMLSKISKLDSLPFPVTQAKSDELRPQYDVLCCFIKLVEARRAQRESVENPTIDPGLQVLESMGFA